MTVMGIRCSNTDFAYAIVEGQKDMPKLLRADSHVFPKGYSKPRSLQWFLQEIEGLITRYNVQAIVIKGLEGKVRRKHTFEARVEHEAMIFLAAANHDIRTVTRKVKSTIAKDLGQKGRARYLSKLDTSVIADFDSSSEKIQEAILSAWSELD